VQEKRYGGEGKTAHFLIGFRACASEIIHA